VGDVRSVFNKFNGNLGTQGSLSFLFDHKAVFTFKKKDGLDMEELILDLIDYGVEDEFDEDEEENEITIYGEPTSFGEIQKHLEDNGFEITSAEFTRIPNEDIVHQLAYILEAECENGAPYSWDTEALAFIGKLANGGMRDAITRLEKVLDYTMDITIEEVANALGTPDYETFVALTDTILSNDTEAALRTLDDFFMSGKDLKLTMRNYTDFLVDVCKYALTQDISFTSLPNHLGADLARLQHTVDYSLLLWMLEEMNRLNSVIKWEPNAKPIIEAQILLMTQED